MHNINCFVRRSLALALFAASLTVSIAETPAPAKSSGPAAAPLAIRINAGATAALTDADGTTWLPDQGFVGGDIVDRGEIEIANTKTPAIYRTEHYDMEKFSYKVPNGKYMVKLHFAETYENIDGPGQRVFSFNVGGHEFKDFDVFVKAGGVKRAYIETIRIEITDGNLNIVFTRNVDNAEINAIEIIPAT